MKTYSVVLDKFPDLPSIELKAEDRFYKVGLRYSNLMHAVCAAELKCTYFRDDVSVVDESGKKIIGLHSSRPGAYSTYYYRIGYLNREELPDNFLKEIGWDTRI